MSNLNSIESQNKKNKNEILYRWYEYSVEVKKIKVKYYCGKNVYALSNKS